jgi:hypothetical protein
MKTGGKVGQFRAADCCTPLSTLSVYDDEYVQRPEGCCRSNLFRKNAICAFSKLLLLPSLSFEFVLTSSQVIGRLAICLFVFEKRCLRGGDVGSAVLISNPVVADLGYSRSWRMHRVCCGTR